MFILGYEVADLDIYDADVVEQIENERDKVLEKCEEVTSNKEMKESVGMRILCEAIAEFIDNLWGKETAIKIFEGKTNLRKSLQAFAEIRKSIDELRSEQQAEINSLVQRYSPNRVNQQRFPKKSKQKYLPNKAKHNNTILLK